MTEDRPPLPELLAKTGDDDFLRGVAEAVVQLLTETDVEGVIGAGRHADENERCSDSSRFATDNAFCPSPAGFTTTSSCAAIA